MERAISTEDPWSALQTIKTHSFDYQKQYHIEPSYNRAFFTIDLSKLINQFFLWKSELPFVTPHYAVKCNPNPHIIQLLADLWCNFDCASAWEIAQVLQTKIDSQRIIYANPIKWIDHLQYAKQTGIDLMTFDCKEELDKIKNHFPEARLVLRIAVDDSHSVCKFNTKFWAEKQEAYNLLQYAKESNLNIVWVSFHVGSGCQNAEVYRQAILDARDIIQAWNTLWHDMNLIDLWGGYPWTTRGILFTDIAEIIRELYDSYDDLKKLTWIAEPWRYMVTNSHTLVTEITAVKEGKENIRYYLNEWLYMSLSWMMFDYQKPQFRVERKDTSSDEKFDSILFWPTCDSLDKVGEFKLPKLTLWDKVIFDEIGDYSIASATTFNGFQKAELFYILSNQEHQKYIKNNKNKIHKMR